ncbi:MAG: hypothetical protein KDE04_01440 [Anaerolineales bacterium]|nr:hypothetical protein [Anaerolineales bacterium]
MNPAESPISPELWQIFRAASQAAHGLGHAEVEPEHLLLAAAFMDTEEHPFWASQGVSGLRIFRELYATLTGEKNLPKNLPLTGRTEAVIAAAVSAARQQDDVATITDLVAALLQEKQGVAYETLHAAGLDPDHLTQDRPRF